MTVCYCYFTRGSGCEVLWWVCLYGSVCLWICGSVCLSARIFPEPHAIFTNFCARCLCLWLDSPAACWRQAASRIAGKGFSSPLTMHISPEPHARSLPNFMCMSLMSVARSSSDTFKIGRIAFRRKGVFFPIDNVYLRNHTRDLYQFLCMLPMSAAWSSSDMFTIGRITYNQEAVFFSIENALSAGKGDGSAQPGEICYLRLPC